MQVKIKQVPNDAPNADGFWVTRVACELDYTTAEQHKLLWQYLERLCDAGHHPVAYEKEE